MVPLKDITNEGGRQQGIGNLEFNIEQLRIPSFTSTSHVREPCNNDFSSSIRYSYSLDEITRGRKVRFPSRLSMTLRSHPKKRDQQFDELSDSVFSEEIENDNTPFFSNRRVNLSSSFCCSRVNDDDFTTNKLKKRRVSMPAVMEESRLFKQLNSLSKNQLVDLVYEVSKLSIINNEADDLNSSESLSRRLKVLLLNIHKALPDRVYGSTRDAVCFKRVEVHLLLFKQECLRQCRKMFNNGEWENTLNYIILSWKIVASLPTWENSSHNLYKEQIFNMMTLYCRKTLKLGQFDHEYLLHLKCCFANFARLHESASKVLQDLSYIG